MTPLATLDPQARTALDTCVSTLRRIAAYQLAPQLQQRLDDLGTRKEFLDAAEHEQLLALVEFSQNRTIEALEAQLALSRLREAFPDMAVLP